MAQFAAIEAGASAAGAVASTVEAADAVRASAFPMALITADGRLAAMSAAWLLDGVASRARPRIVAAVPARRRLMGMRISISLARS